MSDDANVWDKGTAQAGGLVFLTKALAVAHIDNYGVIKGGLYFITDTDGGDFVGKTGAVAGTYTNNGFIDATHDYCGTQFIPTGGDGSIALVRVDGGYNVGLPYNIVWFGADETGVADSLAAFDLTIATGEPVYFRKPSVKYRVTDTIVLNNQSQAFFGDGKASLIEMSVDNKPILQLSSGTTALGGMNIHDFALRYTNQQTLTDTLSTCMKIHRSFNLSSIKNIHLSKGYNGIATRTAAEAGAEISVEFNNVWDNIVVSNCVGYGVSNIARNTAISGSKWGEVYITGATGGTNTTMILPFDVGPCLTFTMRQLNIEHLFYTNKSPIKLQSSKGVDITSVHIEDIEAAGTDNFNALIECTGIANVEINSVSIQGWVIPVTVGTNPALVYLSETGSKVKINNLFSQTSTISKTPFCLAAIADLYESGEVIIENSTLDMTIDQLSYARHTTYPLVMKYNDVSYMKRRGYYSPSAATNKQPLEGNIRELWQDAAPIKGLFDVGSLIHYPNAASAATLTNRASVSGGAYLEVWAGGNTYFFNDWVKGSDNKIYKAIQHNFSGQDPISAPIYWTETAAQEVTWVVQTAAV